MCIFITVWLCFTLIPVSVLHWAKVHLKTEEADALFMSSTQTELVPICFVDEARGRVKLFTLINMNHTFWCIAHSGVNCISYLKGAALYRVTLLLLCLRLFDQLDSILMIFHHAVIPLDSRVDTYSRSMTPRGWATLCAKRCSHLVFDSGITGTGGAGWLIFPRELSQGNTAPSFCWVCLHE